MKTGIFIIIAVLGAILFQSCTKQNTINTGSPEKLITISVQGPAKSVIYGITVNDQATIVAGGSQFPLISNYPLTPAQTSVVSTNVVDDSAKVKIYVQRVAGEKITLQDKNGSQSTVFDVTDQGNDAYVLWTDKVVGLDKDHTVSITLTPSDERTKN